MNRGILLKAFRETWGQTLAFGVGLFFFEVLVAAVLPQFIDQFTDQLTRLPFFQNIIRALLGTDLGQQFGPMALLSIAWVHPVVLSLVWAHEIMFCTRMPAAEVDRCTIDFVLGLPVSRIQAYISESVVWLGSGMVIILMGLAGQLLGTTELPPEDRPQLTHLFGVVTNLFALYVAVGGLAYLVSTLSERRGRAVGTVFALVLASFFLNFLAQFWEPARHISFLGVLHYYRPLEVFRTGEWPWGHTAMLAGLGTIFWTVGAAVFRRRDIRTV